MAFLSGFTAGLSLITLSELGDKTFFVGALLAIRHPRRWVFAGTTVALVAMTLLSVWLGKAIAVLPQHYVKGMAIVLFIGFRRKLLYDASQMSATGSLVREQTDALETIEQRERGISDWSIRTVWMEAFTLTFVAEWGDSPIREASPTHAACHNHLGL